jgi:hypothetical protein
MNLDLRKCLIALISLAALLAVFLLYDKISKTPPIEIDMGAELAGPVAESNGVDFDGEVGKIGDVGVAALKKPEFLHRNKEGDIDRRFGFDELLDPRQPQEKDIWRITNPYMDIFTPDFKCYITAGSGKVQVETAAGRYTPKDATFSGNVVIHIVPEKGSNIQECFIYIEDASFVSEKSQFSTAGPIEFASRQARMLGRGMELVYNDELNRLEFFRITHLDHLRWKGSEAALLSTASLRGIPAARPTKVQLDSTHNSGLDASDHNGKEGQPTAQLYRCVLNKDVVIDTSDLLIFLEDEVAINDIFWSTLSDNNSIGADTNKQMGDSPAPASTKDGAASDEAQAGDAPVPEQRELARLVDEPTDIVITCQGGVTVTPMDSRRISEDSQEYAADAASSEHESRKVLESAAERARFVARRADYNASSGDAVAGGPAELYFHLAIGDSNSAKMQRPPLPAKLSAQKKVEFSSALHQIIFEGDCLGSVLDADPNVQQKHTLSAPKLTIDLPDGQEDTSKKSQNGIRRVTAHGGVVELETIRIAVERGDSEGASSNGAPLGLVELRCHRVEYDPGQESGVATGPGIITVDNSKSQAPNTDLEKLSLRRPCYAFVRNFETLKFSLAANKIVADASTQETLWADYIPIVEGGYGPQVEAAANHVEVYLRQSTNGQTELSTLTASGAVKYEDESYQFLGGELLYEQDRSVITIRGSESQPCYFNGALVDVVEYNLETGERKARIVGPGALEVGG